MAGLSASTTETTADTSIIPNPDTIVSYVAYGDEPNGALYVFGDPSSSKIALLCAGFPDDQTVFLPFAKALSAGGNGTLLVGVMCLPGYDDRPSVPWKSHPSDGFSFDRCESAVRAASKALRKVSTHESPDLIGIFHDWGVIAGSLWVQRAEAEARDNAAVLKPNKLVCFDILAAPSPTMPDIIHETDCTIPGPTLRQMLAYSYMGVHAMAFWISRYLSRHLATVFGVVGSALLFVTGLYPVHLFDIQSRMELYGNKLPGLHRTVYMCFLYSRLLADAWRSKDLDYWPCHLHQDWKETPILYLCGTKKATIYHSIVSLEMLKREETEKRSLSKAVEVNDAGHWMYLQKPDECLKHVLDFIDAPNTFAS